MCENLLSVKLLILLILITQNCSKNLYQPRFQCNNMLSLEKILAFYKLICNPFQKQQICISETIFS